MIFLWHYSLVLLSDSLELRGLFFLFFFRNLGTFLLERSGFNSVLLIASVDILKDTGNGDIAQRFLEKE